MINILEESPDIYNEFDDRSEIEIPLHHTQEVNLTEAGAEDVLTISTPKGGYVHACLTIISHIAEELEIKCRGQGIRIIVSKRYKQMWKKCSSTSHD